MPEADEIWDPAGLVRPALRILLPAEFQALYGDEVQFDNERFACVERAQQIDEDRGELESGECMWVCQGSSYCQEFDNVKSVIYAEDYDSAVALADMIERPEDDSRGCVHCLRIDYGDPRSTSEILLQALLARTVRTN